MYGNLQCESTEHALALFGQRRAATQPTSGPMTKKTETSGASSPQDIQRASFLGGGPLSHVCSGLNDLRSPRPPGFTAPSSEASRSAALLRFFGESRVTPLALI